MTRFVSCPAHVRSASLDFVTVLVDLHTGRVDALLGWAGDAWVALARMGDSSSAPAALGVPAEQVSAFTGRRAGWCHGVAADPIGFHAWIALDGQPVAEPASTARYTPLLHIP